MSLLEVWTMNLTDKKWFTKIHGLQLIFLMGTAGAFWGIQIGWLITEFMK